MKFHLIIDQPHDRGRAWFAGTDQVLVDGLWQSRLLFDDDPSKSVVMDRDYLEAARNRCLEQNILVHVASATDGEFLAEYELSDGSDNRQPTFVHTVDGEWGYVVIPVVTPSGRAWCLKFKNPNLAQQSVFDESPEAVIAKAQRLNFLQQEPPQVSPIRLQKNVEEAQRQRDEENRLNQRPGLRPGDRYR